MTRISQFVLIVAASWLLVPVLAQPGDRLALSGGRIYASPEAPPIYDGVVLIDGGQITAAGPRANVVIPPGVRILDCKGLAIVAGFQNSHVHFTDPARWEGAASRPSSELAIALEAMLTRYGFTTVVDTASDLDNTRALRRRIESGEIPGPRILTAGSALYPADGIPYYVRDILPPEVAASLPQPRRPSDATAVVRQQLEAGADIVKLFTGSWVERGKVQPMALDVAAAAAQEAHRLRKPVFAHASNLAGLEVAVRSGVDVLAHPLDDTRGLTRDHLQEAKRKGMGMIPTLTLFRGDPDVLDEVRDFARLGGEVLFGTDVGYLPDFDHASEYRLMAAAGLGWREILASLTTSPARRFGERATRGTVERGLAADLVVLVVDPRAEALEAESFARVRYTIRGGRVIYDAGETTDAVTVAELKGLQNRLRDALLNGRRDEYASLLAPEWRVTHVDGRVLTKADVLQQMFGGPSPLAAVTADQIEVRLFGDAAVTTGRTIATARDGTRVVLRFSDYAVKRDGRWVIVASHATALPPD